MLSRLSSYTCRVSTRLTRRLGHLPKDESGAAAMEFGLVMPLFVAIFFGVTEMSAWNLHERRAQQAVDFAAEYLSRDNDNILTPEERWIAEDIWQIVNVTSFNVTGGDAYENSRGNYARGFAALEFVEDADSCGPTMNVPGQGNGVGNAQGSENGQGRKTGQIIGRSCEYTPKLDWSFLASQGISQPKRRSCDQEIVENEGAADETSVPAGMVGRGAIVIADFTYKYQPFFELDFLPQKERHLTAIRMSRSGLLLGNSAPASEQMIYCGDTP